MKQKRQWKNQRQNKKQTVLNLLPKLGAALTAGALVIWGAVSLARLQEEDSRVNQVARHFRCICEMNCNMVLSTCSCLKPGGATERKNFIRQLLFKKHFTEQEAIALYNEKFGGMSA